jgi:predicted aldo/keto reductase-like oxidoreductase
MNFTETEPSPARLPETSRRRFIQAVGAAGVSSILAASAVSATAGEPFDKDSSEAIPRRLLGRTGVQISAIGIGGHHLGGFASVDEAVQMIHASLDHGVNFFDNCWEYYNGLTETILGRGLKGRRNEAFLMTKVCTHGRSADLAMRMLEESLRRLQTDHLDLWQIHAVSYDNDPALAYAKGGVLEALDQAKKQGKVRFVGFTGHKNPAFHLKMLEGGYPFDTVQMPLNPFDHSFRSFENQVLPEVNRRGLGALGMKSMSGGGDAVKKGLVTAQELLRYAMSLPVATTISGIDTLKVFYQNMEVAHGFRPMTEPEMNALRARCAEAAGDGRFESYKVSLKSDNPVTRMSHGFPPDLKQFEVETMFEKFNGTWQA